MSLLNGGSASGAIRGQHEVLANPRIASKLADFLDADYRRQLNTSAGTTLYVNNSTGSDTTGTGAVGAPFASINRAIQFVPEKNTSTVTISLANTGVAYAMTGPYNTLVNTNIVGDISLGTARNITTVTTSTDTNGVQIIVDGANLTQDEWEGRILTLTGILSDSRQLIVRRNNATVAGSTTLYCIMSNKNNALNDSQAGVTTSGDVQLQTLPEIAFTGTTYILGSAQLNFRNIKATGSTADIFCNATDKPEFRYCEVNLRSVTGGRGGGVYFIASSLNMVGNSSNGILRGRFNGDIRLGYGCVVTDRNAAANSNFLDFQSNSFMTFEGNVFFRGLDGEGIKLNSANCVVLTTAGSNNYVTFDNDTGTPTCAAAFSINLVGTTSNGNKYVIPFCQGKVNNDYYIDATANANVAANVFSTIQTTNALGGVADVRAQNSGGRSARGADGTAIRGGSPLFSFDWLAPLSPNFGTTTVDLTIYSAIECDTNLGAFTLNLPLGSTLDNGSRVTIIDSGYNASVNNITIVPNGTDTIEGVAANLVMNTNGEVKVLQLMSNLTDWKIIS